MKKGQCVKHPACPAWGIGEVLEISGDKATVNFENAGVKTLNIAMVKLEEVKDAGPVAFKIDIHRLKILCDRFHNDLQHNRSGSNDGMMARLVLSDIEQRQRLTETTKKRLLAWCYTDGAVFQSGVALAREICTVIYGRVLADPDKTRGKGE